MASKKILIQIQVGAKDANIAVDKVTKSLEGLSSAQLKVNKVTQTGRAQSGLNNAILLETGRLASDASFGFNAIANNLSQVISLFQSFARTNGGVVASLKELGRSMLGTGGLLIGIQLLISFGDKIIKKLRSMGEAGTLLSITFKKAGETVSNLAGKFESYIAVLQNSTQSEKNKEKAIQALNKQFPEFIDNLKASSVSMDDLKNSTEGANKEIEIQREAIIKLAKSRAAQKQIEASELEIINKKVERERRLRALGMENLTFEQIKRKQQIAAADEFTTKQEQEQINRLNNFIGAEKAHNQFIKDKREEIEILSEFLDIELSGDKNLIDGLAGEKVTTLADKMKIKFGSLFDFLVKKGKTGKGFLNRLLFGKPEGADEEGDSMTLENIEKAFIATDILVNGIKERVNALNDFGDIYIDKQKQITDSEKKEVEARKAIQASALANLTGLSKSLKILGADNDALKIAAILTEKAEAIGKVIIKTKESNVIIKSAAKARAMLGDSTAIPLGAKRVLANNIMAGVNIAGIVGAAASSINSIRSKGGSVARLSSSGGGDSDSSIEAPDFNVVGAGGVSQLATTLAGVTGQPLKAFVVSKEITSQQELERNITTTAALG